MGVSSSDRKVLIDYEKDSNSVRVKCRTSTIPVGVLGKENRATCDISLSVGFTLNSQDNKNVTYENGKLSLTIPDRLKDYNVGDKSLFDIIQDYFYKFCEKLGFFKIKIEHDLDKPLDHLEDVKPPVHSNEHGNTP